MKNTDNTDKVIFEGEEFTQEEMDILNMEVTPEIEKLLRGLKDEIEEHNKAYMVGVETHVPTKAISPVEEEMVAEVMELQCRMDRGMKEFIHPTQQAIYHHQGALDAAKAGNRIPRNEWNNHIAKLKQLRPQLKKLWDHWWSLKRQCAEIADRDPAVWAVIFQRQLMTKPDNKQYAEPDYDAVEKHAESLDQDWYDPEDIDTLNAFDEPVDMYQKSHFREMAEYDKDYNGKWKSARPAGPCIDLTFLYQQEEDGYVDAMLNQRI